MIADENRVGVNRDDRRPCLWRVGRDQSRREDIDVVHGQGTVDRNHALPFTGSAPMIHGDPQAPADVAIGLAFADIDHRAGNLLDNGREVCRPDETLRSGKRSLAM
jgi:hypothetical protein